MRIEAYAIISEDGMIADAGGILPEALKFEADQRFFERGLDQLEVMVHGRHSGGHQPRSPSRHRLIVTGAVIALARDPANEKALLWNPAGAGFEQALALLGMPDAAIGVLGGTEVFALFLDRYDVFYLTRAHGVRLPGGRPVFPTVPAEMPEQVLARHGLIPDPPRMLDAAKALTVTGWRRPGRN